jgi:hypothetical protein
MEGAGFGFVQQVAALVAEVSTWVVISEHEDAGLFRDDSLKLGTDHLALFVDVFVKMKIGGLPLVK